MACALQPIVETMPHDQLETITAHLAIVVGGEADEMMPRTEAAKMLGACGTNAYELGRADLLAEQAGQRQAMGPHEKRGRGLDACDLGVDKLNARKR